MIYAITAILTLGLLVLVHELGHYVVAKLRGVPVEIFSIGFGRPLWKKVLNGTEFRIGWIPLGGYVAYMDDETVSISPKDRVLVALGGPAANLLFAPVVFALVYLIGVETPNLTVNIVKNGSPAMTAGFEVNDTISAIDGQRVEEWKEVTGAVLGSGGRPLAISVVKKNGAAKSLTVLPMQNNGVWQIGILPATDLVSYGVIDSSLLGISRCVDATYMTANMIFELLTGNVPIENLGGPIMISKIAGEQANAGVVPLLLFIGLLSINFGLMNLLPLPVLDGGQIVIFSLEAIFGRSLSDSGQMLVQRAGVFLLLFIFGYTVYNDITRIVLGS
jgi:regulator of sigma E protease